MYSTNLKDSKYSVICFAIFGRVQIIDFIVDTGAMFTCCHYMSFDQDSREEDFKGNEIKLLGGFVKSCPVRFYKLHLNQFTIGNIDMGEQDLWVTFDKRVTDSILGMDILQQVIFTANPYDKKIYFCKDSDDYNANFKLLTT